MPIELTSRLRNAWNAFTNNKDPTEGKIYDGGFGYSYRPDRPKFTRGAERSIVNAVYNRIAMDVAAVDIRHVKLDESDRYLETIHSALNECLSTEANIDQTGRSFIQDVVMSMFDEGVVAVVPVDTQKNPNSGPMGEIYSMRTAKIIEWRPDTIRVHVYNDQTGKYEDVFVYKKNTLIIENPLYAVINEPNSTMQRLIRKLSMLDSVDEQSSSGKLDLIIQLPYTVRSELRKQQARERKSEIEQQLSGSKYGIAYIDSAEHITQLNRAVENNLMTQIEYLTNMVYSQLGITAEILNGTADEKTMLNYNSRTIEPILSAIIGEMRRKWITKTSRAQGQSIMFFREPFKLVPASSLAELADKFTRNEIMSSNEFRQILGMKKSDDPNADQLRNKNINQSGAEIGAEEAAALTEQEEDFDIGSQVQGDYDDAISELDSLDTKLDDLEKKLDEDSANHSSIDDFVDSLIHFADENELSNDDLYDLLETDSVDEWFAHTTYASPYYDPVKRHEYYMRTRQLVGRKSTSGLNDDGKEAAAYVKMRINEERDKKLADSKSNRDQRLTDLKNSRDSKMSELKDRKTATVQMSNQRTKNQIARTNEQRQSEIASSAAERDKQIARIKSQISGIRESHSAEMNNRIKALSEQISGSGKSDESKERIREKIAKLREENSQKRSELQELMSNSSAKFRAEHNARSSNIRERAAKANESSRQTHKQTSASASEEYASGRNFVAEQYKNESSYARSQYTAEAKKLREQYDQKYVDELDKIKEDTAFQKEKKSTKSTKSGSSSDKKLYKYKNHQK